MSKQVFSVNRVVIRFAGDSGDGMQLTGDRFTSDTAGIGNDLSTLPDFPAEIRAPAGTIGGVSAFQLAFADHDITTPGDAPNVLITMNRRPSRPTSRTCPAAPTSSTPTSSPSATSTRSATRRTPSRTAASSPTRSTRSR